MIGRRPQPQAAVALHRGRRELGEPLREPPGVGHAGGAAIQEVMGIFMKQHDARLQRSRPVPVALPRRERDRARHTRDVKAGDIAAADHLFHRARVRQDIDGDAIVLRIMIGLQVKESCGGSEIS